MKNDKLRDFIKSEQSRRNELRNQECGEDT